MTSKRGDPGWLSAGCRRTFRRRPEVTVDREKITVVGTLAVPDLAEGASDAERAAALRGRIEGVPRGHPRQAHRDTSSSTEHRTAKVAWASRSTGSVLFTTLSVPAMTRLRRPSAPCSTPGRRRRREVADALAWCVKLVGKHSDGGSRSCAPAMRRSRGSAVRAPRETGRRRPIVTRGGRRRQSRDAIRGRSQELPRRHPPAPSSSWAVPRAQLRPRRRRPGCRKAGVGSSPLR